MSRFVPVPPWLVVDPLLLSWLREDVGRGDRTAQGIVPGGGGWGEACWRVKADGVLAGLPMAGRVFRLLDGAVQFEAGVGEGEVCRAGQVVARMEGPLDVLLMGERVALNLVMRLSGVATLTRQYVERIEGFSARLVDTRKTTPGLRLLEKYATQVGGAVNHRFGLDDAVMVKDNHIVAAGGIGEAIRRVRGCMPYPLKVEVEVETLEQVLEVLEVGADIVMLDNMPVEVMKQAVGVIRERCPWMLIEASGNVTLETICAVAGTGVDFISSSGPVTRSPWLDISMRMVRVGLDG